MMNHFNLNFVQFKNFWILFLHRMAFKKLKYEALDVNYFFAFFTFFTFWSLTALATINFPCMEMNSLDMRQNISYYVPQIKKSHIAVYQHV